MTALRVRVATQGDVDAVARIVHGAPGREPAALLGGEERARRLGFALVRLQAEGPAWGRTLVAELAGRRVGVLQWRRASEPVLPPWPRLARVSVGALGIVGALHALRYDGLRQRMNPAPPAGAFHVEELHVLPDVRGRGIGGRLLAHAEEIARAHGHRTMSLVTHLQNPAQALYRRMGFEEAERREDPEYERVTGVSGRVLLQKRLAPVQDARPA